MKTKTQKNYSNSVKKDDKFVTKIIEMLDEVNSNDWEKYTNFKMQIPKNLFTKKEYKGFNILTLAMDTMFRNFGTSFYASFNSISKAGGKLKKGAKGVMIEFFSFVYQDKETGKKYSEQQVKEMTSEELKKIFRFPCIRTYTVFNSELIENFDEMNLNILDEDFEELEFSEQKNCEDFLNKIISNGNLVLNYKKCDVAFYNPISDFVQMPSRELFISEEKFYSTLFHEIIHWTGNEKRLNRELKGHNDILSYSFEELIAEMGSMLICFQFGITTEFLNSVRYLQSWGKVHKNERAHKIRIAFTESKRAKKFLESL